MIVCTRSKERRRIEGMGAKIYIHFNLCLLFCVLQCLHFTRIKCKYIDLLEGFSLRLCCKESSLYTIKGQPVKQNQSGGVGKNILVLSFLYFCKSHYLWSLRSLRLIPNWEEQISKMKSQSSGVYHPLIHLLFHI